MRKLTGKTELIFLINLFIFRGLRGKGLNAFFNQPLLNGFLHFQQCLHHNSILAGKQV